MLTAIKLIISAGLIYLVNEVVVTRSKPFLGSLIAFPAACFPDYFRMDLVRPKK